MQLDLSSSDMQQLDYGSASLLRVTSSVARSGTSLIAALPRVPAAMIRTLSGSIMSRNKGNVVSKKKKKQVKQPRYRPGAAQSVPGS